MEAIDSNGLKKPFASLETYLSALGGGKVINKILVANNGLAAIKCIKSIRKWSQEMFGDEYMVQFVAMATPDDIEANAEYIRMADECVTVPGGANINNYANVDLIIEIAERTGVQAVWAGWGHASEYPRLPDGLAKTKSGIAFMGPPGSAMQALGDKISSTLVAQSAGVSCIPWSGSGITLSDPSQYTNIPEETYRRACVETLEEALAAAARIGYPLMVKASEGGGGKGIRKCLSDDDLRSGFRQVQGEVPGSPIFLMKLAHDSRHLEIQLLADGHGSAIALYGRDCSVQRRHQKIIEEGPIVAAPRCILTEMERSAVRLAESVGYVGVGTVEYLYSPADETHYFLELNPRLQVEHPVTEWVTGVNLPAAQLHVAMGIPLHRIPDIRRLFGQSAFDDTFFDVHTTDMNHPDGHVVACRITAENAVDGFRPTAGSIQELTFRALPGVWAYFSVGTQGAIHKYSDSQFGHVFARGKTREDARKLMLATISQLGIRGEIRDTTEYLTALLKHDDFVNNRITTQWLDGLIEAKMQPPSPDRLLAVACAAVNALHTKFQGNQDKFLKALERGQQPAPELLDVRHTLELVYGNSKFTLIGTVAGPNAYLLSLNGSLLRSEVRTLPDNVLLVMLGRRSHVVSSRDEAEGTRLRLDQHTCSFTKESDPSKLRTAVAGKLVRFLVEDGCHVSAGQAYAEVEVMKMYLPLVASLAGTIHLLLSEGTAMDAGQIVATLDLDDPSQVKKAQPFSGTWEDSSELSTSLLSPPVSPITSGGLTGSGTSLSSSSQITVRNPMSSIASPLIPLSPPIPSSLGSSTAAAALQSRSRYIRPARVPFSSRPHRLAQHALEVAQNIFLGYDSVAADDSRLENTVSTLTFAVISDVAMGEAFDVIASVRPKLPKAFLDFSSSLLDEYTLKRERQFEQLATAASSPASIFAAASANTVEDEDPELSTLAYIRRLRAAFDEHANVVAAEPRSALLSFFDRYSSDSARSHVAQLLSCLLHSYLATERRFDAGKNGEEVIQELRELHRSNLSAVWTEALSHRQLVRKSRLALSILCHIESAGLVARCMDIIKDASTLQGRVYLPVAQKAKHLLMLSRLPSYTEKRNELERALRKAAALSADPRARHEALQPFCEQSKFGFDFYLSFFNEVDLATVALEAYVTKAYVAFNVDDLQVTSAEHASGSYNIARWYFSQKRAGINPGSSVPISPRRAAAPSGMINSLSVENFSNPYSAPSPSPSSANGSSSGSSSPSEKAEDARGFGMAAVFKSVEQLRACFGEVVQRADRENSAQELGFVNVLQVLIMPDRAMSSDEENTATFADIIQSSRQELNAAEMRRVTFVIWTAGQVPQYYTYRRSVEFTEDPIFRHIEPTRAFLLELRKLANYQLTAFPIANRQVRVYYAEERPQPRPVPTLTAAPSRSSDGGAPSSAAAPASSSASAVPAVTVATSGPSTPRDQRFFVRVLVQNGDALSGGEFDMLLSVAEDALISALDALELAMGDPRFPASDANHIFMNFIPDIVLAPERVQGIIAGLAFRHEGRLAKLRVSQVEIKLNVRTSLNSECLPMRFLAFNITGYKLCVELYAEVWNAATSSTILQHVFSSALSSSSELSSALNSSVPSSALSAPAPLSASSAPQQQQASASDGVLSSSAPGSGSLHLCDVMTPYPVTTPLQHRRMMAAKFETVYCYDFPSLFEDALEESWQAFRKERRGGTRVQIPRDLLKVSELVLAPSAGGPSSAATGGLHQLLRMSYDDPMCGLREAQRPIGQNDIGMVAWLLRMRTPEYPEGREIVVIANDITFQNGSFGTEEDLLFARASQLARKRGLPRIYLAANSGARIGVASEVRDVLKAAWVSEEDPSKGFKFLYLSDADHQRLSARGSVKCSPATLDSTGELVWKLTDIIGEQHGLGVENLQGSGLIAGETSRAYDETFTLTYVTGRSVGIGAYLVRLGQRTIQNKRHPIILTGAPALNKVLGSDVYTSNAQLGGIQIMYTNGVSHLTVSDDKRGVQSILQWLSFVPRSKDAPLPVLAPADPVDRDVEFTPKKDVAYDPRALLSGLHESPSSASSTPVTSPSSSPASSASSASSSSSSPASIASSASSSASSSPPSSNSSASNASSNSSSGTTPPNAHHSSSSHQQHRWVSGLFDRNSFVETLSGWAQNVVCGRARLGGIPVGVVAVETRTISQIIPADPADPSSQEKVIQKAGQVWFPDSAYKTAQAIRDLNREGLPLFILANWRGFSGGMRDMFDEVLKFGSYIVDALREYSHPVTVYMPPQAELRGGAWVVVDPSINPEQMEMYADNDTRGGVLEPEGIVEIKMRARDLTAVMNRLDPIYKDLRSRLQQVEKDLSLSKKKIISPPPSSSSSALGLSSSSSSLTPLATEQLERERKALETQIKQREQKLMPTYRNVAVTFADLHDTPGRMKAKGVIQDVVAWRNSRRFFYWRLRRRLEESHLRRLICEADSHLNNDDVIAYIKQWLHESTAGSASASAGSLVAPYSATLSSVDAAYADDQRVLGWLKVQQPFIEARIKSLRSVAIRRQISALLEEDPESVESVVLAATGRSSVF